MNNDVEKGNLGKDEKDGKTDDADFKKDVDADEPAEDSPLKGKEDGKENEAAAGGVTGEKKGAGGCGEILSRSRVKWWIAVLLAIALLALVLVVTLMAVDDYDTDPPDPAVRIVRLWPRPNKSRRMIQFRHGSLPHEGRVWPELTRQLDQLLIRYRPNANRSRHVIECYDGGPQLQQNKACKFDIRPLMMECSSAMNYGYDQGKPCVFLEFANISNWVPELYSGRELEAVADVPSGVSVSNLLYLDCQGDTLVDQENMGRIQYTPDRGFPTKFFPYKGHPEYMSPIVAIRFSKPAVGVVISVTCKFWAKNLNHTEEAVPTGLIAFNLLVD